MARPLVGHRELRLDQRILLTEFRETRPHPFQRRLRRQSFAGPSGAGEKRLDLPQLLAQLGFSRHPADLVIELAKQSPTSSAADVNKLSCAIHPIPKSLQEQLPCSPHDVFIAWLNRCRRLAKDWENLNCSGLAFLKLASIRLML